MEFPLKVINEDTVREMDFDMDSKMEKQIEHDILQDLERLKEK
jgi:hypothetical protein